MARVAHQDLAMRKPPTAPAQKTSRRTRRARRPSAHRTIDVMTQLTHAVRHPQAALLGGVLGGAVPWFARALAHGEIPQAWTAGHRGLAAVMVLVVLGCAAFSMLTVYKFGATAFGDERKAVGFVVALEGVMLVSQGVTSLVALLLLVVINAVANGCVIASAREATQRRQADDARRSATRAQNRARTRAHGGAPIATTTAPVPVPSPSPRTVPAVSSTRTTSARRPSPAITVQPRWMPDIEAVEDAEIVHVHTYS